MAKRIYDPEGVAFEVVRRATQAKVCKYDDGSEPGMVDAVMEYPDGRTGALEVTSLGDEAAFESKSMMHRVFPGPVRWEELTWSWSVRVPRSISGVPAADGRGTVHVMPDLIGPGWPSSYADAVLDWVDAALRTDRNIISHREKLFRHDADEHHLFVRVDESAPSFDALCALLFVDELPTADPDVPDELTGLWLLGRSSVPLVWRRGVGWTRLDVLGSPGASPDLS